jgi:hypothetical protein
VLRCLGYANDADALLRQTLQLDPLDALARFLLDAEVPSNTHIGLDLALDFLQAGFDDLAIQLLTDLDRSPDAGTAPLVSLRDWRR